MYFSVCKCLPRHRCELSLYTNLCSSCTAQCYRVSHGIDIIDVRQLYATSSNLFFFRPRIRGGYCCNQFAPMLMVAPTLRGRWAIANGAVNVIIVLPTLQLSMVQKKTIEKKWKRNETIEKKNTKNHNWIKQNNWKRKEKPLLNQTLQLPFRFVWISIRLVVNGSICKLKQKWRENIDLPTKHTTYTISLTNSINNDFFLFTFILMMFFF